PISWKLVSTDSYYTPTKFSPALPVLGAGCSSTKLVIQQACSSTKLGSS
ncbi:2423_t:CDS:1, partial [Gigaspora margarita]